jgi:hypothetical protein
MVVQSGVNFDGFGLRFQLGQPADGMFARDMFAISTVLDLFSKLGKPLHITAVEVPSQAGTRADAESDSVSASSSAGYWHEPWSETTQSEWLYRFYEVALSKPFVESICWQNLWDSSSPIVDAVPRPAAAPGMADHSPAPKVGHGGLLRSDLAPKTSYKRFLDFRKDAGSPATNPT